MPEWFTGVAIALIGLAGTVVAAYIGYRQWQRTRSDAARADFTQKRRKTYETLWEMVETTHIELRRDARKLAQLRRRVADVNSYILKHEVYLAAGDHDLVNRYLSSLGELISWAESEGDSAFQVLLESTAAIPMEATAAARAFELRNELMSRVRAALEG